MAPRLENPMQIFVYVLQSVRRTQDNIQKGILNSEYSAILAKSPLTNYLLFLEKE